MEIKVLGPGCAKCNETEKIMRDAAEQAGVAASFEKVGDFQKIAQHGVFSTPAVVVDGQIKCVGRVPGRDEALAWLKS